MSGALSPAAAAIADAELRRLSKDDQGAILALYSAWTQASRLILPPGTLERLEAKRLVEQRVREPSPAYRRREVMWRLTHAGAVLQHRLNERAEDELRREAFEALSPQEQQAMRQRAKRLAMAPQKTIRGVV